VAWQYIGSVTVSPATTEVVVGSITVPTTGGLQVKMLQTTSAPFQFGYGLLSYRSTYGKELGIIRVWPRTEFTSYWMGEGLTVVDNQGLLVFEPRTWNLRWVEAGFPLSIDFLADLPTDLPGDRYQSDGFADGLGNELFLSPSGPQGRIGF
jgi:hypothetical protein